MTEIETHGTHPTLGKCECDEVCALPKCEWCEAPVVEPVWHKWLKFCSFACKNEWRAEYGTEADDRDESID